MDGHFDPLAELGALENADGFVSRHVAPSETEIAAMLREVGAASLDDLAAKAVPAAIRGAPDAMDLPPAADEVAVLAELRGLAGQNECKRSLIGQGYYGTHVPPVIGRNILENPGWYTAYTPYQAEIAQGRLEALLNFQTMVCDLTSMPIANASLLDEATATAEAMTMARGVGPAPADPRRAGDPRGAARRPDHGRGAGRRGGDRRRQALRRRAAIPRHHGRRP